MECFIKSIKLISEGDSHGFLVEVETEDGIKNFGGITDHKSFRKLFFGLLSICNNYDISDLAKVKNKKIACLFEHPDSLEQKIAAVGSGSRFLVNDNNEGYVSKKFNYKMRKLLKSINALQTGKIISVTSASLTIYMTFDFKCFSQGVNAPKIFAGLGYPLVSSPLSEEDEEYAGRVSESYIVNLMKTVFGTEYLYDERKNPTRYKVQYLLDENGDIVSLGNTVYIEGIETPLFINKYDESYKLEREPLKKNSKNNKMLEVKKNK